MSQDWFLENIAEHFGQQEAVALLRDAQAKEEAARTFEERMDAIEMYKRAYRQWPALDSGGDDDGLPRAVREAAQDAGIDLPTSQPMDVGPSPRFPVEATQEWLQHLSEHGYCVIAGVADPQEIALGKSLLWDYLENVPGTQVKRDDPSSWDLESGWRPSQGTGIMGGHGFGQSAFCWHTRLLSGVQKAFAAIWNCEDLIVSFDGGNVFRPWARRPEWKTEGSWWHIDQNASLPGGAGRISVQGFVTFTDATPATGGLCVAPGSHKHHLEVCDRAYSHQLPAHFVPVRASDPVLNCGGGKLVCAKAGDLVLWDSRCVHCNTPGVIETDSAERAGSRGEPQQAGASQVSVTSPADDELLRVVGYVCMVPTTRASQDVLAKRRDAFINNVSSNHWPQDLATAVPAPSWLQPNDWDLTNELQRRMIVGA